MGRRQHGTVHWLLAFVIFVSVCLKISLGFSCHPAISPFPLHKARRHPTTVRQSSDSVLDASSDDDAHFHKDSSLPMTDPAPIPTWPCWDALDKRLLRISLPIIANFAINPILGAVDLFWVSLTKDPLAVAGQAAANQVYSSVFWLTSFLPSVSATLISKAHASGDKKGVQDAAAQALLVGSVLASLSSLLLFWKPNLVLSSVLTSAAPAMEYARPYLFVRSFAFLPAVISLVGFSTFRGVLETVTPVKISLFANLFNALLDPILIFTLGWGVTGAAVATLVAEVLSACLYVRLLWKRQLLRKPSLVPKQLKTLLKGGAALQLRNVALNVAFLAVARVTLSIDPTGVAAAAHALAIQVFQVGGIVLLGLSTVAQTVVPNDLVQRYDEQQQKVVGGKEAARSTVRRLMSWGLLLGVALGSIQIALLPIIQKGNPLKEVQEAARIPSILASFYQIMNGLVFIGEGVMVGTGSFLQLSLSTVIATGGLLWALKTFPPLLGLSGVWVGFGVFNVMRLAGVSYHQFINGPLATRRIRERTREN